MNPDPDANPQAVVEDDTLGAGILSAPQIRPIGSREFASTLITNVVIQACTIVQGILVARLLGPVGRGQFAAAILWPGLFAAMGGMCVGGTVAFARVGLALWHAPLAGPMEPVKAIFREALPYGFAGLLNPLTQSADKALLLYLLGTTQLGFYAVALTAASVVNSLAGAAGIVSFGMSTQAKDREGFDRVARMFRFTAWTWLLAGVAVGVIIPIVLPLLYGAAFRPAVRPAILLIPAAALAGQASILEESMRAKGRAFIGLEARAAGLLVMVAAGWLLAPVFGILGVVFAAIGSQAIILTVMTFAARWHFHRACLTAVLPRMSDLLELKRRLLRS